MWKQFFYFNKSQRIGIVILLSLIFVVLGFTLLMPYIFKQPEVQSESDFLREAEEFKASLVEKERTQRTERDFYPFQYRSYPNSKAFETKYELFAFNPNTADSAAFVRLGLKPHIARNILKYRAKGGNFRTPEAFSKVYGITPEKFEELRPYIQIPATESTKEAAKNDVATAEKTEQKARRYSTQLKTDEIVNLNLADTAMLKQVRGIGTVFARRIVSYRNVLGGYSSVEQLKEVWGMTDETYGKISPYLAVDQSQITKIDVNKASIEKLKKHPYIKTFQRAKAIYEYRRKKIELKDISQLKHLEEFTPKDWQKLEPYLAFE